MKSTLLILFGGLVFAISAQAQVPTYVPSSGLAGWFPFNGNANDESGNGGNGILSGGTLPTSVIDRFGNTNSAFFYTGSNSGSGTAGSHILLPSYPFNIWNQFSLSMWVKEAITYQGSEDFLTFGYEVPNGAIANKISVVRYNYISGQENVGVRVGNTSVYQIDNNSFLNKWKHYIVTFKQDTVKFYIDGVLIGSQFVQLPTIPNGFASTARHWWDFGSGTSTRFQGVIDDIGIWNRALTQNEITQLYTASPCVTYQTITVTDTLIINANLTGINPVSFQNSIKVYPNPSKDHITIDFGSNYSTLSGYTLKIGNSLSQTVYTTSVNQQSVYLNLNGWTGNGLYFVYLYDNQGNLVDIKKIILQ